jgi:AcrR family transcriptional regulator
MSSPATGPQADEPVDWQRRVVGRSLQSARQRSIDRGAALIRAAATVLERSNGDSLTVQEVADEAGQSLRTLYLYFESKDDLLLAVFEEAMGAYARLIERAVAELDDPVERLAGCIIAAVRMPANHPGVDRGLARLRLQLAQADPERVARAQRPVTALLHQVVTEALAATPSAGVGSEPATYLIAAVRTSFILSATLGNDYGMALPDPVDLSRFCLGGLGMDRPRPWHEAVDRHLVLSDPGRPAGVSA